MRDVLEHLGLVWRSPDELVDEPVLGREHEEGRPEQRVRARREDGDVDPELRDPEHDVGSLGAADPVALHRQDALGPRLEQLHLVEQPVRVGSDAEEPLLEVLRDHLGAAALAAPVDHLLVREHGLVVGTPLDRRLPAVGEAGLEEAQEDPLRPAVVVGLAGRDLARPVDRPAHASHLPPDRLDVALRDRARMAAFADRGVLRVKPEGVVAHGPKHRVALAAAECVKTSPSV